MPRRILLAAAGAGLLAACTSRSGGAGAPGTSGATGAPSAAAGGTAGTGGADGVLAGFDRFAPAVRTTRDGQTWVVESDGMPAHPMMVGIRSWQQQVPLPQPYTGANAWRLPALPRLADEPVSARTGLFRGAIALAVNGVPIFNALNNRGDDAYLAGELDQWGGHAGRADDYHYHVAPLHLATTVGAAAPVAYALDGFPIYGEVEPDGSPVAALDELNGHVGADGTYHYHGTRTYPYLNGGLRGVVSVRDGQLDPQPTTRPFRPDGRPLSGATITGFLRPTPSSYRITYSLGGGTATVAYETDGSAVRMTFTDTSGAATTQVYRR